MVLEDGILFAVYGDLDITLEIAEEAVESRHVFTKGKSYPLVADISQVASITKEARLYFSSDVAVKGITAGALLVNSAFSTFIGNFFLSVTDPNPFPSRLFRDRASAIKWLQKFKELEGY